jgi:nicotinate-nucleotide pyrophosphorylase (carboxylating)
MGLDTLDRLPLPVLAKRLLGHPLTSRLIDLAIDEDLGRGDVTTELLVDPTRTAAGAVVAREGGVLAGLPLLETILRKRGGTASFRALRSDGDRFEAGDAVLEVAGPLRALLPLERTMLNLLGALSGVATRTATFVAAVKGTRALVCDTRKTTPGLRMAEKYAVRCGGGSVHRLDLSEAMLVKDNHLIALDPTSFATRVAEAALRARRERGVRFVEVEVDTLEQLDPLLVLPAGSIDAVLLDNMTPALLRAAVERRDAAMLELSLEASGGVTLESIRSIAESGVDRISCGSLTRDRVWIDFGLDLA